MVLNVVILFLILITLTVHRYLSSYWQQRLLPNSMGFLMFPQPLAILCLINFIWMFGLLPGTVILVLTYFQIIYSAVLWVFLMPWVLRVRRAPFMPEVNFIAYGSFPCLIFALAICTIINFFVSDYKSMVAFFADDFWTPTIGFVGVLIVGNLARVAVMRNFKE